MRSLVLCCMLSSVHACTSPPSRPRDAPVYRARDSRVFRGARDAQVSWPPLFHLCRALQRAPLQRQRLYLLLVPVCRMADRFSLASPCPHLPARLVQRCTLTYRPLARMARPRARRAQTALVQAVLLEASCADLQAGELRGGVEAARLVLGHIDDARHDGQALDARLRRLPLTNCERTALLRTRLSPVSTS